MMTAEQIDEALRATRGGTPNEDALRSLADLSVSVLRMIDARRERGIAFGSSYNEEQLRRALASMAQQEFPPGPPMVPADLTAEEIEALRGCSVHSQDEQRLALATRAIDKIVCRAANGAATRTASGVLDEVHDFQRFEHVIVNRIGDWTSRELKIVCRCGWAAASIDRDPDDDIAVAVARGLLQAHVTEAIDRSHERPKREAQT